MARAGLQLFRCRRVVDVSELSDEVHIRMRTARSVVLAPLFAALLLCVQPAKADADYLARAEVRSFIESMHLEYGLEREALERILGEARRQPAVMRLIGPERPTTLQPVRSYPAYPAKFLTKPRIAAGARFGRFITSISLERKMSLAFRRK